MTTVLMLEHSLRRMQVAGLLRWAVLVTLALGRTTLCVVPAAAQDRPVHWLNAGAMPPGAIGSLRLQRGGPLPGYFQPVRIRAPEGARIALAAEGFDQAYFGDALVGMQIGPVYRLMVTDIPNNPGLEVFPTIEVVDRLYPPPGLSLRFPIPIELTQDELELAARGSFVTRVIYVEDPHTALPIAQPIQGEQPWIEAPPGEDPLVTADERGRPVAILRIGARVPNAADVASFQEPPPFVRYDDPNFVDGACPIDGLPVDEHHAVIDEGTVIYDGTVIDDGTVIENGEVIEEGAMLEDGAMIAEDAEIEQSTEFEPAIDGEPPREVDDFPLLPAQ
jgi:hypothetical protein